MTSKEQNNQDDPDIAIIKARKMKELWKKASIRKVKGFSERTRAKSPLENR